ncbi:MAG: tetratricopeptide repeat protein, partial [Deltaproteobacteria bacterium]|nr:tetratricopeptide repeat protein [Deltaproteobacteria bacterium]
LAEGEPQRAVAELERAAELVPRASEIRNHLGLAYWASGREAEARQAFEAAIDLDCDNAAARQNLESLTRAEPDAGSARESARGVLPGEVDGG